MVTENYRQVCAYLEARYPEIDGYDFYRDIFPNNENAGELHEDFSHPNAIYLYKDEQDPKRRALRRRIMLNDTWEEDYTEFVEENPMTLCSGLTYHSRANRLKDAQCMNALIFDLDGVGLNEIQSLFLRFGGDPNELRRLPMPTYLVASGSGLHIYYVFDKPIDLYPNIKLQLKSLKYDLTFRMWDYKGTTQVEEIQYQSINQSFRMVGSTNAKYGSVIRAFRTGERVTLEYLNGYAKEKNRVNLKKPFRPSQMRLEEAKEKYPDWYQRTAVEGHREPKKWDIKGKQGYALYDWWLNHVNEIKGGHRYFFLMCMAIYACKCDVPKKKLREDMKKALAELERVEHHNPDGSEDHMHPEDIKSAMEAYDKAYYNFTINDIEHLTDVRIERNKRNGLKQNQHLYLARRRKEDMKAIELPMKAPEGRPKGSGTAQQRVAAYQAEHPEATVTEIARGLGISRTTVYKWVKKSVQ